MHTYVHSSTVYNSEDLELTQMSINDRLDNENVAHIHHGIWCSHKKWWSCILCKDMDESGNHHSQKLTQEQKIKHHMFSLFNTTYEWENVVFDFLFSCQFAENDGFQIIHVPTKDTNSSFFMAASYSMVYMCHIFLVHSIIDGHLGWFQVFAIVNSAVMNIRVHVSL